MIKDQLKTSIQQSNFQQARLLVEGITSSELEGILLELAYDTESVTVYDFVSFLIEHYETVELHIIAASLMNHPLCFLEGAYAKGLHHIRRAIELAPTDISLKEMILFYSLVPDELVTKEEAVQCAKQILLVDPDNKAALDFLNNHK